MDQIDFTLQEEHTELVDNTTNYQEMVPRCHRHLAQIVGGQLIEQLGENTTPFAIKANYSAKPKIAPDKMTYVLTVEVRFFPGNLDSTISS